MENKRKTVGNVQNNVKNQNNRNTSGLNLNNVTNTASSNKGQANTNGLNLNNVSNNTKVKQSKQTVSKFPILPAIVLVILAIVLSTVYTIFKKDVSKQRELVIKANNDLQTNIENYSNSIVPFLAECVADTGSTNIQYDTVLQEKRTFDSSADKVIDYKKLKETVDNCIAYTSENKDLVSLKSYKDKLDILRFYETNVNTSLSKYNEQVENYSKFINSIKYKFISNDKEFKIIE